MHLALLTTGPPDHWPRRGGCGLRCPHGPHCSRKFADVSRLRRSPPSGEGGGRVAMWASGSISSPLGMCCLSPLSQMMDSTLWWAGLTLSCCPGGLSSCSRVPSQSPWSHQSSAKVSVTCFICAMWLVPSLVPSSVWRVEPPKCPDLDLS